MDLDELLNERCKVVNGPVQSLLDRLIEETKARNLTKVSSTAPNVANLIAAHLRRVAPRLADIPGIWFSGSNVWRWLYAGDPPSPDADIDVFFIKGYRKGGDGFFGVEWEDPRQSLLTDLGLKAGDARWESVRTGRNLDLYTEGCKFMLDGRKVDCWRGHGSVAATLNDYPTKSHAHCRAAFSFTEGLVVLPNEAAGG